MILGLNIVFTIKLIYMIANIVKYHSSLIHLHAWLFRNHHIEPYHKKRISCHSALVNTPKSSSIKFLSNYDILNTWKSLMRELRNNHECANKIDRTRKAVVQVDPIVAEYSSPSMKINLSTTKTKEKIKKWTREKGIKSKRSWSLAVSRAASINY